MAPLDVLEIPEAETDEDFIAPRPHAIVRRPAAEAACLLEDDDILRRARYLSGQRSSGNQSACLQTAAISFS
jgi:hypothetical protein